MAFNYTVASGANTADLTVTAFNLNGATIMDGAGNSADLTGAVTNPSGTLQIDTILPHVASFTASDPLLTSANTVHYTLTFSEPVTGVDAGDFSLITTGVNGASIASVTPVGGSAGAQYTVTVNTGTGSGTIGLGFSGADVQDLDGNRLPGDTFQARTTYPAAAGGGAYYVAIADLNGDGKPDLVVANEISFNVSVLLGNGNGTFQSQTTYAAGSFPIFVVTGDLNGDGKLDLVVANDTLSVASGSTVSVLLGNGDGTFQTPTPYATETPFAVAIGDLNGDGKPDLVTANAASDTVSVLLGNGNGTFQAQNTYPTEDAPYSVAIGDLNGDGKLDLAAVNYGSDTVSLLLGNGDGTFQTQSTYPTEDAPYPVAIGDLNGDGELDLLIGSTTSSNVSVLFGNGDSTFQTKITYETDIFPFSVAIGDLNGDGRPDLVTANNNSGNVSVLRGNGNGTFQPQTTYAILGYATSLAIGDLNGDGRPDLVTASYGSDAVSVLLNSPANATGPTYTIVPTPVIGTPDDDVLFGTSDDDLIDGLGGADYMAGFAGNDIYFVENVGDQVMENFNEGNDIVYASIDYTIGLNVESVVLLEGAGNINAAGNNDVNALVGNSGNNALDGKGGADYMVGGAGNDIYYVDSAGDQVVEHPNEGNDIVYATFDYTLGANVESVVLVNGAGNIDAAGNGQNNALVGNSGNNALDGKGGADHMVGGAGDDLYYVDSAGDEVVENANEGNDIVYATYDYTLGANVESVVLVEGAGNINAAGNNDVNALIGNSGNNALDGKGGADHMVGGDSDDIYYVDNAGDEVVENTNEGNDIVYASVDYTLGSNVDSVVLTEGAGDISATGNSQVNALVGNSGGNNLDGKGGDDTMIGGAGNDHYFVDSAGDQVVENFEEGDDTVITYIDYTLGANIEALIMFGTGNINATGNSLGNAIYANSAANTLDGKGGADNLTGGAGNDTFRFQSGEANGDIIIDFNGNGGLPGDSLQFVGFGTVDDGATFTAVGARQWQIHSGIDGHDEFIILLNDASVHASDYAFV